MFHKHQFFIEQLLEFSFYLFRATAGKCVLLSWSEDAAMRYWNRKFVEIKEFYLKRVSIGTYEP
jgi:hypothetical protein